MGWVVHIYKILSTTTSIIFKTSVLTGAGHTYSISKPIFLGGNDTLKRSFPELVSNDLSAYIAYTLTLALFLGIYPTIPKTIFSLIKNFTHEKKEIISLSVP